MIWRGGLGRWRGTRGVHEHVPAGVDEKSNYQDLAKIVEATGGMIVLVVDGVRDINY